MSIETLRMSRYCKFNLIRKINHEPLRIITDVVTNTKISEYVKKYVF